jgi:hypothetical protein
MNGPCPKAEMALLMGDILLDEELEINVWDGISTYYFSDIIPKGAWFANPMAFFAYLGLTNLVECTVTGMDEVTFSLSGSGAIHFDVLSGENGRQYKELFGNNVSDFQPFPWVYKYVLAPTYPIVQSDVGAKYLSHTAARSSRGTSHLIAGEVQPTRALQLQLGLDSVNYLAEVNQYRWLWEQRFAKGRSCTFWHGSLPAGLNVSQTFEDWGAADQLIAEPSLSAWSGQRVVEYRNVSALDDNVTFLRRPNNGYPPGSVLDAIQTVAIPPARFD